MKNMSVKKIVAMIVGAAAVLAVAAVAAVLALRVECGGSTDRAGYRRRRGDRLTGGQQ